MQLFDEKGPRYVRLDDDVSFQILRTNPKLTTNTKLMYDGENLYMDSYSAVPLLSTMEYKHHRVWKTGLFNRDIRNFLLGTNTAAYAVGQTVKDTIMLDSYDDQFENMYWCGVESVNSKIYPQEMGCIAPLYLRKKRPNYFVIFKIDNPANTNTSPDTNDRKFEFDADIQNRMKILKAFDLREGTPIGNYIKRYVEQRDFKYDQSIYVNFSSHEIYYYGIDKKSGVLTQKVENFEEQLLKNDNTIMKMDDWITSGFERNNLIFPYIINLEFLFDDKDIEEYKFARYFGMYCNDIDLYDMNISGSINTNEGYTVLTTNWDEYDDLTLDKGKFYYIKDKYKNIFTVNKSVIPGQYKVPGEVKARQFTGFEPSSVSTYAERLEGTGKAMMILEVNKELSEGDKVIVTKMNFDNQYDDGSEDEIIDISSYEKVIATFTATDTLEKGESAPKIVRANQGTDSDSDSDAEDETIISTENIFSCKGNINDMAHALADAIKNCESESLQWVTAFNIGNKVIIRAIYPGINMNGIFNISFDQIIRSNGKITKITESFLGGTNYEGCLFKVDASDKDMFFDKSGEDRDSTRYLKCGAGEENAEILTLVPYIIDDNRIDEDYMVIITDNNGRYANMSKTGQIEIIDRFYAKLGMLSFFPVRDFDFDTVYSAYGEYSLMKKELDKISRYIGGEKFSIPYSRFFYENNNNAENEYDYFFENYIPGLTTLNKTVPFINKWGYADESKDSCENPYRLNTSKIFDACNFSANTFMQKGDIMEYTHSMPYYIDSGYSNSTSDNLRNEYQYLDINDIMEEYSLGSDLEGWIEYFSKETNDGKNPFDKMFGDTSSTMFTNKRFNRKYSRFLAGNTVNRSSTLFRGVKFEIVELENSKEVHTGKYNDYKFSFIYVPVNIDKDSDRHTVNFIKNDKFKFIVGIVFFNIENDLNDKEFNKAYVYASTMGFLDIEKKEGYSSGGGENEMSGETGGYDTPESGEGNQPATYRRIMVKFNRRNTRFTFYVTTGGDSEDDGDIIIPEKTVTISPSNTYVSVYDDVANKLVTGYVVHYSATTPENGEVISGEYELDGKMTQNIDIEFEVPVLSQPYMQVNGTERNTFILPSVSNTGGQVEFGINSNIEYDVRITSDTNFGFFTVDGETYSSPIHCSGTKTLLFEFDEFNEIENPDMVLSPRNPDVYTATPYTYGGTKDIMYRGLKIYIDVPAKYQNDVQSKERILTQYSSYADPDNQAAEIQNLPDGFLNGEGGDLEFQLKPSCYWYIRSIVDEGYGIPNAFTFFPAEGGPSDDWITINASWLRGIASDNKKRTIELQVCSVITDEVLCTNRWEILPKNLNDNPSGENANGDSPVDSFLNLDTSCSSVLGAFVGCGIFNGKPYPNNKLDIYKEGGDVYVYVKSYVTYTLERSLLPVYVTAEYVPWAGYDSTEGQPGHHIYKFTIAAYESSIDVRPVDFIKFTSTDSDFRGSANIYLTQHNTSTQNEYKIVKSGDDYAFENPDDPDYSQAVNVYTPQDILG